MNPYKLYQQGIRSRWKWIIILITGVYLLSPIDAIPEILVPFVGLIDDGILLSILVRELMLAHRKSQAEKRKTLEEKE